MSQVLDYFAGLDIYGWLEILAMVVGIYYVYLEIRKTRLLWYICILTSILNIFVYQHNNYLSMTVIQFYYIVTAFYGLHAFREIKEESDAEREKEAGKDTVEESGKVVIRRFEWKTGLVVTAIALPVFFALAHIIRTYAETHGGLLFPSQPWWDAFISVGSMVGTFFLSRSYICHWILWIVLDVITVGVFIYSGMYWMALMYLVYIVMAVIGFRNWLKNGIYVS